MTSSSITTSLFLMDALLSNDQGGTGGVVITGAANGVGFAYAKEFVQRGYDVVICDVQDCSAAARALSSLTPTEEDESSKGSLGSIYHTKCDVSDPQAVEKLGQFAQKNLGTIQYWINNAGKCVCVS